MRDFYRTIEHTADIGIEVEAPDTAGLLTRCALAMFDMMFGLDSISKSIKVRIAAEGDDIGELLVAWLNEVLYVYAVEKVVFSDFVPEVVTENRFSAIAWGEKLDPGKHDVGLEIKAATYHALSIEHLDDTWKARVIFDV